MLEPILLIAAIIVVIVLAYFIILVTSSKPIEIEIHSSEEEITENLKKSYWQVLDKIRQYEERIYAMRRQIELDEEKIKDLRNAIKEIFAPKNI